PTMYYGDELGMEDVPISPAQVMDPHEKNVPGKGLGRDPERTPMQWDSSQNAGFTSSKPWLPISEKYTEINVEEEIDDQESMLSLYKKLIAYRNNSRILQVGDYVPVYSVGNLLAYKRVHDQGEILIVLNLGTVFEVLKPEKVELKGDIVVSTHLKREGEQVSGEIEMGPNEGVLIELQNGEG